MKKQPIHFTEVILPEESQKKAFVRVSDLPQFVTVDMVRMHFENQFSHISSLEMEGNAATVVFDRDQGEREWVEPIVTICHESLYSMPLYSC